MRVGQEIVSCVYDATLTSAILSDIDESKGYVAVTSVVGADGPPIIDNDTGLPVPRVKLSSAATDQIYGALVSYNSATGRVGVQRTGIVPFRRGTSARADIGLGVIGAASGNVTAAAANVGRGTVIARNTSTVFVDLDVDPNALS